MGALEIDHYVPLARGGTNAVENLWFLCHDCNAWKWMHTPDELPELGGAWGEHGRLTRDGFLVHMQRLLPDRHD